MTKLPKISVIVAIFNAQKTLERLTDSLKAQTMHDFEVLLIDDGSTDTSGMICDRISDSDNRFRVFHKPNEGIGATRQFGLEHASGDYTIHTDADDWVEPDYLKKLYEKAISTTADIVICDVLEEQWKKTVYNKQEPSSYDTQGMLSDMIGRLLGGPWNKLIKRSFYVEHDIRYIEGLNYGEDKIFNLELVKAGASVTYLPEALYHLDLISNLDSAVRGISVQHLEEREKYITILRQKYDEDIFKTDIDNINLGIVYLAICSKAYSIHDFYRNYSFLSRVKWKDYAKRAFLNNLIIWTSLHCSYRLALMLAGFKKATRHIKQKLH